MRSAVERLTRGMIVTNITQITSRMMNEVDERWQEAETSSPSEKKTAR